MKDYLNQEELNDFMIIGSMLDATGRILGVERDPSMKKSVENIRAGWAMRNNMTKEEHKNLKMAETFLAKWYQSIISRLSDAEVIKIAKRHQKFTYRIMDQFTLKRVYGEIYKEMETVKLSRDYYQDWCIEIMNVNCKNCTKHHSECKLNKIFEDTLVPESSYGLENCRYAYTKKNVSNG